MAITQGTGGGGAWGPASDPVRDRLSAIRSSFQRNMAINNAVQQQPQQQQPAAQTAAVAPNITSDGAPMEDTGAADAARAEAERIINEAYGTASSALDQFEGTLQPGFETTKSGLLRTQETQTGQARGKEQLDLASLAENERVEGVKTESAIAKARREAGEMFQGISARFGGSTGTGQFGSELVGRQSLENIGGARNAFQQVRGQIVEAGEKIKFGVQSFVDNLELQTQNLIEQAQQTLREQLAAVAGQRGQLAQAKAESRLGALQNYQAEIAGINQRNTQLKQDIFLKAQDATNKLAQLQSNQVQKYNLDFNPTENVSISASGVPANELQNVSNLVGETTYSDALNRVDDDDNNPYAIPANI